MNKLVPNTVKVFNSYAVLLQGADPRILASEQLGYCLQL